MANFYKAMSSTKGEVVLIAATNATIVSQYVTNYSGSDGAFFTNVSEIIKDNPAFDNTFTLFCPNETLKNYAINVGFSQAYYLEPNEIITFSNGSKIVRNGSKISYRDKADAELAYDSFSGSDCYTFRSPPKTNIEILTGDSEVNEWAASIPSSNYYYSKYRVKPESKYFYIFGYGYNNGSKLGMIFYGMGIGNQATRTYNWYTGLNPDIDDTDPYGQDPNGTTGAGGGTGDFDETGDDIDFPSLPTLSAVDTGFITLFNPTAGQLKNLADYLWGDLFDVSTWKKIFADPMDAILGMSIVPVYVPNGSVSEVTVGNIGTGVSMTKAGAQYVEVDCGTLNVKEYWGAYLDYDPYTKAEIYLPYVGTHPLAVDDIMGKSVHVKYHVDILSGSCCAYVKCGGSVMYSFVGQCSCSIPITGNDWTNVINGALSIAASIGTMVATGGASAPMSVATIASTAVNSMKPNVEKSGSMGGMGGMLGVQTPYLIITRPRQALPARQNTFKGYPSFITMHLADCSGYTEIESVHLENIPATEQELSEIENLLKGGVIL